MKTKNTFGKRILSLVLTVLLVLSLIPMSVFSAFAEELSEAAEGLTGLSATIDTGDTIALKDADGDGYYDISTADELYAFAALVNGGNLSLNAELTADIVVNEGVMTAESTDARAWTPIGNDSNSYTGTFEGNNKTVSGLYFNNSEADYIGLFGYVGENGAVKNTGVINSYFNGYYYVGGVAGENYYGTITNCYNTGFVSGAYDVGGVVGYNYKGTITNCYNTGFVSGSSYYVGGVAGDNYYGTITNCYNTGEVSGVYYIGGVAGDSYYGTITNCYYLDTAYTGGIGLNNSPAADDVAGSAEAKTAEQFKSGEVAYLLQGTQEEDIWGQKIGTDQLPVLGGDKVYYGYTSCVYDSEMVYTNTEVSDERPAHKEFRAEFTWDEPYDGECYVSVELYCAECGDYVDSGSGYATLKETVEAQDCMHPGYELYEVSFEYKGVTYTDTKSFALKSDNHVGELENGFCTECGGYEAAKLNDNGTPDDEWDDYYEISNAGQLYWFAEHATNDQYSKAVLTDDIIVNEDMNSENLREWISIGESSSMPYCGSFDGQGHSISGLYAKSELNYIGLFGAIGWGASISNLGIKDSYFEGNYYVGGIVGYNDFSYIKNCYAEDVEVVAVSSGGALVGYSYGEVSNSYSTSDSFVGNNNYGTITNCYYLADEEIHDEDGLTFKTADQFASGEVAYLLQSGVVGEEIWDDELGDYVQTEPEHIWGQKIGEDTYPVFGGDKVYQVENCIGDPAYSNANENGQHNFVNGFCTVCGGFEPATLNEDGVYEIGNAGQLYWFAELVNSGNTSANAILTADIVVNEGTVTESSTDARVWTPIGNNSNRYTGAFDGNNKTVSGLYFNNTDTKYVGLFGYIGENSTVKNTGVINSYFNGLWFVGGVVGANYGTITNCYNTGDVSSVYFTGGIAGQNCGTITRSYNTGIIEGFEFIGGVAGCNDGGTITNCYNIGEVSGSYEVGGVVGKNFEGIISNCYNTGEVSGANDYIGGVAGTNQTGTITNCYYLDTTYAGGIGKNNTVEAEDIAGSAEAKTAEQFASGEVAYLLQGEQTEDIWGQKIGTDELPTVGGDKVYYGYASCVDDVAEYTNNSNVLAEKPDHNFVNGFCTVGGEFESATLNSQGFYEISNAGQLYWFADKVNNDYANFKSVKVILTDNIVVNEGVISADSKNVREWIPIGTSISKRFAGVFYGNNKTISGLYCNNEDYDVAGLFGYSEATIAGVGVINSYFSGASVAGSIAGCYIGGRKIENCYSTSIVNAANAGGIVGHTFAVVKVQNCYFTGEVTGTNVGGIVGYFEEDFTGTITNCYYLSTVCSGGINRSDLKGSAEAKTIEQFKSGEVAYLLQGEQSQEIWGQEIGTDTYPIFGGDKVYYGYTSCADDVMVYTNNEDVSDKKLSHDWNNGVCSGCNKVCEHNFEKGFCTVCGAMDGIAQVKGYTISLKENIAVNYYMVLADEVIADENAKMVFTVPNGTKSNPNNTEIVEIAVKDIIPTNDGYYVFTCEVAAKEMASVIKAQIIMSDGTASNVFEYTVKEYAEHMLANPDTYAKEQALVKAMLNYGASAQVYFNYNADNLANNTKYMSDEEKVVNLYGFAGAGYTLEGEEAGVKYYGTALSLESELAFKHYFIIDSSVNVDELTIDCKYDAKLKKSGNLYELKISGIPAHQVATDVTVKLGNTSLTYSIASYGELIQNNGDTALWTVVSALTDYSFEASLYANK